MTEHGAARTRWTKVLPALALFYTAVAVVLGTQDYLLRPRQGWSVPWSTWVLNRFTQWIVWTAWTPFVAWLGGRFRLDREPRLRNRAVHAAAIVVVVPVIVASDVFLLELLTLPGSGRSLADKLVENLFVPWTLLNAWFLVAALTWLVVLTVSYTWRYRREALESTRLQAELAEAELQALKSQLQPHFLFNSLNAIAALTTADPPAARRVVHLLAGLLRRTLADAGAQEVPLAQEIEFARSYLEVEQVRFPNRLSVRLSVDPGVERVLVPHLVLQPLVENAVRHGIEPKAEPGTIRIEADVTTEGVRLAVIDDGVGRSRGRTAGAGVALANLRVRLARLYGSGARLETGERSEGGFAATVVVPLRTHGSEPGSTAAAALGVAP